MATFENLVPDVRYIILKNASTTEFLWSLIRASPAFYNTFLSRREDILSSLIAEIIGPEVWDDAVAALSTDDVDFTSTTTLNEIEDIEEKYKDFHNDLANRPPRKPVTPLGDVLKLLKTHRDVMFLTEKMTSDLLERFNQVANSLNIHNPKPSSPPISRLERCRLYRAWYRYMFMRNALRDNTSVSLDGLRVRVLRCYSECQVEELHCVVNFVDRVTKNKWRQVGDEYLDAITQTDPREWDISSDSSKQSRWDGEDRYFSESFDRDRREAFFRGLFNVELPVLRRLLTAEGEDLRRTIKIPMNSFAETTLANSMSFGVPLLNDQDAKMPCGEHPLDQSEGEGWLWAYGVEGNKRYRCPSKWLPGGSELRDMGYIFWDSTRFQASKIMEHSVDDVVMRIRRATLDGRIREPPIRNPLSVERRLQMFYKLQT